MTPQSHRGDGVRASVEVADVIGPGPRRQLYALPTGDCQRRCAYLMIHLTTAAALAAAEGGGKAAAGRCNFEITTSRPSPILFLPTHWGDLVLRNNRSG